MGRTFNQDGVPHIRINLLPVPVRNHISVNWQMLLYRLAAAFAKHITWSHKTDIQIKNVETVLFESGSYQKWLRSVNEDYIIRYLSQKEISKCHPLLINAVSMYPFRKKENIRFVCGKFQELLLYAEDYHQTDILVSAAGFLEAAGFKPAVQQLIWRRNYFLTKGFTESDGIIIILKSAIQRLQR